MARIYTNLEMIAQVSVEQTSYTKSFLGNYSDAFNALGRASAGQSRNRLMSRDLSGCMADQRIEHLAAFYETLSRLEQRLGGRRTLLDEDDHRPWPVRGVYFFFEPGELRSASGVGDRLVRVASRSTPPAAPMHRWGGHLSDRGGALGKGNHRSAIFRRLVGEALLRRSNRALPSWGVGGSLREAAQRLPIDLASAATAEADLEFEVSAYIRRMPFVWIEIPDAPSPDGRRDFFVRHAVALLSNSPSRTDPPSPRWLGRSSSHNRVCTSGLWNNNHVQKAYDPRLLDAMGRVVESS